MPSPLPSLHPGVIMPSFRHHSPFVRSCLPPIRTQARWRRPIRPAAAEPIRSILDMFCSHRQPIIHACQADARAPVDPYEAGPFFDAVAVATAFTVDRTGVGEGVSVAG